MEGKRRTDAAFGRDTADTHDSWQLKAVLSALEEAATARVERGAGVEALVSTAETDAAGRLAVRAASRVVCAGAEGDVGVHIGEHATATAASGLGWSHVTAALSVGRVSRRVAGAGRGSIGVGGDGVRGRAGGIRDASTVGALKMSVSGRRKASLA